MIGGRYFDMGYVVLLITVIVGLVIIWRRDVKAFKLRIKQLRNELVNTRLGHSKEWQKLNKRFELAMAQNYCTICGRILDGYVPPEKDKENGL